MKRYLFLLPLILITAFSFFSLHSCKKDNNKGTFNLDKEIYQQLELAIIDYDGVILDDLSYDAEIGGIAVSLVRVDTLLYLIMPDIATGAHQLMFTIDKQDYELPIMISETPSVTDADTYVSDILSEITWDASELDSIIAWTSGMAGNNMDAENRTILLEYLTNAQNALNAMSTSEKEELARFFNANADAFEPLEDLSVLIDSTNVNRFGFNFRASLNTSTFTISTSKIKLVALVALTGYVCASSAITSPIPCVISAAALVYKAYKHNKLVQTTLDKVFIPISNFVDELLPRNFTVEKDRRYAFEIMVERRTLYNADLGSADQDLSAMELILDESESTWGQIMGIISTPLSGNSNHIKNESTYKSVDISESEDLISVGNISNSNVSLVSQSYMNNELTVIFTTNEVSNQVFNFDVIYDDGIFQNTSTVFSALLDVGNEAYTLQAVSGNNQTAYVTQPLANPIRVRVLDSLGNPFEGEAVTFSVIFGGGSVSASSVITDAGGYAQTNWTLGASAGNQALRANASVPVGSPVTFTATANPPIAQQIVYVSGNNQTADVNTTLLNPIRVRVLDNFGNGFAGQNVIFSVQSGGGTISSMLVPTDANGYAQTTWALGSVVGSQTAQAGASVPQGSPVVFNANGNQPTFTDTRDGQTYAIVVIGNQTWFAENLNYNAAGSYPSNMSGRFYEWNDALTVCPAGWHLPSDAEWNTLEFALGMPSSGDTINGVRGTHGAGMKSTSGWNNNGNGTNSSGFNVRPAGMADSTGLVSYIGTNASFWTASTYTWVCLPATGGLCTQPIRRRFVDNSSGVVRWLGFVLPYSHKSIRCIQD